MDLVGVDVKLGLPVREALGSVPDAQDVVRVGPDGEDAVVAGSGHLDAGGGDCAVDGDGAVAGARRVRLEAAIEVARSVVALTPLDIGPAPDAELPAHRNAGGRGELG